ncbi:MAG: sensor histidine kinase [Flavipsychrobacter sp.]|nr:sensor histidine kinase [Flavipsychrobacter sp.]
MLVLLLLAIHVYIFHVIGHFGWGPSLSDGACSTAMISLSIWGIVLLIRTYPTTAAIYPYAVLIALFISVVTAVGTWEILKWWVIKNEEYKLWVKHTMPIRFLFIWVLNSWMATNSALRKNINALDTRFQNQTDASVLLKEAELFKLRQQLQPHFLYNSLNSINALIMISPDKAQEMIGKLSDFLRSSVQRESEDTLPVKDELAYIQSYLAIESVRFGDRLQVAIDNDCSPSTTLPPFLLQPILENAIKFGLYGKTGTVKIDISIISEANMLVITITNPYDSNLLPPKGTGFGLEGIRRRLYLLYARTDLLETKNDEETFTTILKIPQQNV